MAQIHLLVNARGSYATSSNAVESWSMGVRCLAYPVEPLSRGPIPSNVTVLDDAVEDVESGYTYLSSFRMNQGGNDFDLKSWVTGSARLAFFNLFGQSRISTECLLEEVVVYPIDAATGKASDARSARCVFSTPKPGTITGNPMPLQIARVFSWNTSRPGPKGKGRMYVPGSPSSDAGVGGLLSTAHATSLANDAKNLLTTLSNSGGGDFNWWVTPIVTGKPYEQYATINQVRVGRALDTQRRRRRNIDEGYVTVTL